MIMMILALGLLHTFCIYNCNKISCQDDCSYGDFFTGSFTTVITAVIMIITLATEEEIVNLLYLNTNSNL